MRIEGFWSEVPLQDLTYIPDAPPEPQEENPGTPPGDDYFWLPGYYDYQDGQFNWLSGKWVQMDPNWVLTPAYYVWRPDGYVLVASYWDWPVEKGDFTASQTASTWVFRAAPFGLLLRRA